MSNSSFGNSLYEEAVQYAIELLSGRSGRSDDGWDETVSRTPVNHAVELLAAEFRDAIQEQRGMHPYEVRHCVQAILDAAKFDKNNEPYTYDPDADKQPDDPDHRVFRYFRSLGRNHGSPLAIGIAYTVGAVKGRFDLPLTPRMFSRSMRTIPHPSALEVVAEAQFRRGAGQPLSANGIRNIVSKNEGTKEAFNLGITAGKSEREKGA